MQNEKLLNKISTLSQEQAAAVEQFVDYLREQPQYIPQNDLRTALESFIREHADLLRRLAQ